MNCYFYLCLGILREQCKRLKNSFFSSSKKHEKKKLFSMQWVLKVKLITDKKNVNRNPINKNLKIFSFCLLKFFQSAMIYFFDIIIRSSFSFVLLL